MSDDLAGAASKPLEEPRLLETLLVVGLGVLVVVLIFVRYAMLTKLTERRERKKAP
jgi:hypothetical protein